MSYPHCREKNARNLFIYMNTRSHAPYGAVLLLLLYCLLHVEEVVGWGKCSAALNGVAQAGLKVHRCVEGSLPWCLLSSRWSVSYLACCM
jgi:hypothetical protein